MGFRVSVSVRVGVRVSVGVRVGVSVGVRVRVRGRGRDSSRVRAHEVNTETVDLHKGGGPRLGLNGGGRHVLHDGLDVAPSPG